MSRLECEVCGEDNIATAIDMQTEKAKFDGVLPPLAIKKIREELGLTQKEADNLFGGGVNAFSRYERGINPPSQALSLLLMSLESNPKSLKKLLKMHDELMKNKSSANDIINSAQTNTGEPNILTCRRNMGLWNIAH